VRVPDLDWPIDLFTDASETESETIVARPRVVPAKSNLWRDMVNAWFGEGAQTNARWPAAIFQSEQLA